MMKPNRFRWRKASEFLISFCMQVMNLQPFFPHAEPLSSPGLYCFNSNLSPCYSILPLPVFADITRDGNLDWNDFDQARQVRNLKAFSAIFSLAQ
jgi:hypothetical protein